MKIKQCKVANQVRHFPWMETLGIGKYNNPKEPCVFFGCYTKNNFNAIYNHLGVGMVFWTGRDVLKWDKLSLQSLKRFKHVTWVPSIARHLNDKGIDCELVPFFNLKGSRVNPLKKEDKIFAYYQRKGVYTIHGGSEIDRYINHHYHVQIPGKRYNWQDWYEGACERYYNCFVGLALDDLARGVSTIKDIGLRGGRCITNVIDLPNTIPWQTEDDIYQAIIQERKKVGTVDEALAQKVWDALDWEYKWLEI